MLSYLFHIEQILESNGYTVKSIVDTDEEAVKQTYKLLPDLVIMNLNLNGELNEIKAVMAINQLNIPILLLLE